MSPHLARWTRVVAAMEANAPPHPEDAEWFVQCYRYAIETGCSLEAAYGLVQRGGAGGLARQEAQFRRNTLLRDLAQRLYRGLEPRQAARAIIALAERRRRSHNPAVDDRERMVDAILLTGQPIPGLSRLADIVKFNTPFELHGDRIILAR